MGDCTLGVTEGKTPKTAIDFIGQCSMEESMETEEVGLETSKIHHLSQTLEASVVTANPPLP